MKTERNFMSGWINKHGTIHFNTFVYKMTALPFVLTNKTIPNYTAAVIASSGFTQSEQTTFVPVRKCETHETSLMSRYPFESFHFVLSLDRIPLFIFWRGLRALK